MPPRSRRRVAWLVVAASSVGASDDGAKGRALNLLAGDKTPAASEEPQQLLLTRRVRERMLRRAEKSLRGEVSTAAAGWHSLEAERLLEKLLHYASSVIAKEQKTRGSRVASEASWGEAETEALWLLCRTQLGGIEASLHALDAAAKRVSAISTRWHTSAISLWMPPFLGRGSYSSVSAAPLLGSARSRFGVGARHRALLRSERLLMVQAGMLHDLRVAITRAGGEWLEYGSWLGGPPVRGMEWDVQISAERRRELLSLCASANEALSSAAHRLTTYGPYALYRSQPWAAAGGYAAGVLTSNERTRAALDLLTKLGADTQPPLSTLVRDILAELYGAPRPSIDTATAAASRKSLHRALEEFVREVFSGSEDETEAAAVQAAAGSMEVLLEEQVEYADQMLKRNDFSLQLMAVVPALLLGSGLLYLLRAAYQRLRTSSPRGPIEDIRRELVTIQRMLNRAAGTPSAGAAALTKHEASPMDVATAGELVFRVQRLRVAGARWLRGWLKTDILTDANELLDSGRLSVLQRAQLANSLLRRLDNSKALIHHW
ncbi:hypothetical protein EMIHUDRAFT_464857 [Emiliania huxleyi CCMP1516]|uniref:Nuclear control of ATPase protein 2 n=2 Tax=Emiliania huxleyi TaxID=2903 RepID=A0A0D3IMC3_EMIH1|nr:hypothetical protein EMIHUDRAFT_464857 [Emiliania huxleyi CCMP1516]EOD12408.1 hypothetical protein EMIHUDRAFT_464857 [Emiliania huxleyi CCMP1516]|eukprot:XP_005764837.1 hypothetical protein EMIHUDRAFT_464857 [Emiliania huxleyi CCMP1516]